MGNNQAHEALNDLQQLKQDVKFIKERLRDMPDVRLVQLIQQELWSCNSKIDRVEKILDRHADNVSTTPKVSNIQGVSPGASALPTLPSASTEPKTFHTTPRTPAPFPRNTLRSRSYQNLHGANVPLSLDGYVPYHPELTLPRRQKQPTCDEDGYTSPTF